MSRPKQPTALFIADSHFHLIPSQAEQQRLDRFLDFLTLAEGVDHLFLVGDIFDFWFDYPHFRLRGYDVLLAGLDRVREHGTSIHFVGGNHDIWASAYLHERYGSNPDGRPEICQLGDLRVKVDHGDGLLAFDWAYSAFRSLVRNHLGIVLAKSLHPEILFHLSTWLSGQSRSANRDQAVQIEAKADAWLRAQVAPPWDLLVIGHVHHPYVAHHEDRRLASLAGWFDSLGYGLLHEGRFQLLDFADGPPPELAG